MLMLAIGEAERAADEVSAKSRCIVMRSTEGCNGIRVARGDLSEKCIDHHCRRGGYAAAPQSFHGTSSFSAENRLDLIRPNPASEKGQIANNAVTIR
jgi:hypothetical protein